LEAAPGVHPTKARRPPDSWRSKLSEEIHGELQRHHSCRSFFGRLILGGGMASGGRGFVNDAWSAIHPQASFSEANMPK
jgi:hypothetical protein